LRNFGAGEGIRTLDPNLARLCSTPELHPLTVAWRDGVCMAQLPCECNRELIGFVTFLQVPPAGELHLSRPDPTSPVASAESGLPTCIFLPSNCPKDWKRPVTKSRHGVTHPCSPWLIRRHCAAI